MPKVQKRLDEILRDWGLVTQEQVDEALKMQKDSGERIGECLVSMGACTNVDVTKALATQFDMEYVDLDVGLINSEVLQMMPEEMMREYMVLPLAYEDKRMKVAITDPLDVETIDTLRFRLGMDIDVVLSPREQVQAIIQSFTEQTESASVDSLLQEFTESDVAVSDNLGSDSEDDADSAPVIRLVHLIIVEAVRMRASDIHIEPMADRVRVRYRVDGVCVEHNVLDKRLQGSITSRLKIMAGMQIEEKRLPQDGRIRLSLEGKDLDFRVSTLPSYHGESVVLRILHKESVLMGLESLGFQPDDLEQFEKIINRPNGIFLVTGPTGSGKTTTLYAALNQLNTPARKIITAEDPVEYHIKGINQVQVHQAIGLTFESILRAMLRQAPNVILVGEIRDLVTADMAIQAALTGHLVFSTLHTNDAPSTIARLIDMGVKPFLVASSIQAAMAQRLVRILCKDCKEVDTEVNLSELRALGVSDEELEKAKICKPVGCPSCNETGYYGRLGIFEVMVMNSELREMAFQRRPTSEIRRACRLFGMRTLMQDGLIKVLQGITTLDEVVSRAMQ